MMFMLGSRKGQGAVRRKSRSIQTMSQPNGLGVSLGGDFSGVEFLWFVSPLRVLTPLPAIIPC